MAETADRERQMNLAALQQRDPYITTIKDSATSVAIYTFNAGLNEWEKTEIEGTLFVYIRSAFPIYGFMIINRLGLRDLIQPINQKLEFQLQDPFLLYRTEKGSIYGIWFYDRDECARLGQLMNSLVQVAGDAHPDDDNTALVSAARQRRASESDSLVDLQRSTPASNTSNGTAIPGKNVDILQMLSKAQDEYDKTKGQSTSQPSANGATATAHTKAASNAVRLPLHGPPSVTAVSITSHQVMQPSVLRPKVIKARVTPPETHKGGEANKVLDTTSKFGGGATAVEAGATGQRIDAAADPPTTTSTTPINLDALFKRLYYDNESNDPSAFRSQVPPIKQIMTSHQNASTLEEIERRQITSKNSVKNNEEVPSGSKTDASSCMGHEPESPNTVLRRTLNIAPPPAKTDGPLQRMISQHNSTVMPCNFSPSFAETQVSVASSIPLFRTVSTERVASLSDDAVGYGKVRSGQERNHKSGASVSPECLVTPQALLQTCYSSKAELSSNSNVLMSPMEFQAAGVTSVNPNHQLPSKFNAGEPVDLKQLPIPSSVSSSVESRSTINPLTKEQLQQSLIHLLQNDPGFLCNIHAAYVQSLNQGLSSKGNGHL